MANVKKEQVKGKVKRLLLGKKQFLQDQEDEQLEEQAIDQGLLSAIAARQTGGLLSQNNQRRNALQLVFLLLLLEDRMAPATYDNMISTYTMPGRDQNATLAMANVDPNSGETESRHRTIVRQHIQTAQSLVGVTADGDLGHGTLGAIEKHVAQRINGDQKFRNFNVGGDNRPMSAREIVMAAIRAEGLDPSSITIKTSHRMSEMVTNNVNAALDAAARVSSGSASRGGASGRAVGTPQNISSTQSSTTSSRVERREDTTLETLEKLKQQGDEITGHLSWWNDFNNQLTLAVGGSAGIGVALTDMRNAIGNGLNTAGSFVKSVAIALNKYVPGFKKSESVVPLAVVAALAVGGAFALRKYLKDRRNIRLARKLAADRVFMAEIDRITRSSGLGSYRNSKDAIMAIRELERLEARNARYMRYM